MSDTEAVSLLLYVLGAFLMPILSGVLGIPAAVTEILFGVLIGEGGLRLAGTHGFLAFMSEFGFAYLMFLAGMELNFTFLERQGPGGLLRGGLAALGILLCSGIFVVGMDLPLFYLLVLSALSIGILVVLLQEWNLAKGAFGQNLLLVGSLGEFATITLLTIYHILIQKGFGLVLFWEGGKLIVVLLVGLLFLKTLQMAVWWFPEAFHRLVRPWDPSELGVRAGFLVMMGFVAISAFLRVEYVLGAFVAGAAFSYVFRERGILEVKLASAGYGFFIPIFFIHVGVTFHPAVLFSRPMIHLALVLFTGVLVSKFPVLILTAVLRRPFREILASPFLLASPLTLLIAVSAVGLDLGAVSKDESDAIVLVALLSALLFPILGKFLMQQSSQEAAE